MTLNITKKDIVDAIVYRTDIPAGQVKSAVECLLSSMAAHLIKGETIEIRGFGTFFVQRRKARPARNPRTGAKAPVPRRLVPVLRFSPAVRSAVAKRQNPSV
jgi:nucleoid DNA-binding protein